MKNLILIAIALLFIISSCKKDDLNSDKLKIDINWLGSDKPGNAGQNTVNAMNITTTKSILSSSNSQKYTYETKKVLPGDKIDITYLLNCNCDITIKYKGKLLGRGLRGFIGVRDGKEGKLSITIPK